MRYAKACHLIILGIRTFMLRYNTICHDVTRSNKITSSPAGSLLRLAFHALRLFLSTFGLLLGPSQPPQSAVNLQYTKYNTNPRNKHNTTRKTKTTGNN